MLANLLLASRVLSVSEEGVEVVCQVIGLSSTVMSYCECFDHAFSELLCFLLAQSSHQLYNNHLARKTGLKIWKL